MKAKSLPLRLLLLLPALLLSCGAFWQSNTSRALEQARTGEYKAAADALESAVEGGNNDAGVVESLFHSWVRQGEYVKARTKFDAWVAARPNAGPIRLAAGRIHRLTGSYDIALTRTIADRVPVPVIASGGVGTLDHLVEGIRDGHATAVLAASIFHFGQHSIAEAKAAMAAAGVPVRP